MLARCALLLVAVAVGTPSVSAEPGQPAAARQATKKKKKRKKPPRKKHRHKPRKQKPAAKPADDVPPAPTVEEPPPATTDEEPAPVVTDDPEAPEPGAAAEPQAAPQPQAAPGPHVAADPTASVAAVAQPAPAPISVAMPRVPRTWFIAGRIGPSIVDRRGSYDYKSSRAIYSRERNLRWEVALGRYVSRHFAVALAGGSGPYPKFDAEDPLFAETTRFIVFPWHATASLELHAGAFLLAVAGGGVYERAHGSFTTQDPATFRFEFHTVAFERFGAIGSARTGLELHAGHLGIELLAEAAMVRLWRGSYEHDGLSSPGISDHETGYVGWLLVGLRWH